MKTGPFSTQTPPHSSRQECMAQEAEKTNLKFEKKSTFQIAVLLSLAIHGIFALSTALFTPQQKPKNENVVVDFVNAEDLKNLAPDSRLQMVEQDKINDEKPAETKYLGAHNQVVQKETVAQKRGEFQNLKQSGKKKFTIENFTPKYDIAKSMNDREAYEKEFQKRPDMPQGQDTVSADSQSNDYLKDVDQGKETLLSTKEFVYYTFYSRIRNQLNQYWGTKVREKLVKLVRRGRYIASTEDKITKLLITLDERGTLVKVQILSDSGVRDLDEAAIEAFKAAAPFPNPPSGIVDQDGMVKIRWDFIVEA